MLAMPTKRLHFFDTPGDGTHARVTYVAMPAKRLCIFDELA
jgi:hypothetical protein